MTSNTHTRPETSWKHAVSNTYFNEIGSHQRLTAEEERELSTRVSQGDREARERMILANLRLVVSVARQYMNRGVPLADLVEEGNLGLLRAVEKFDPDHNTRFSTYAVYWIREAIRRALNQQGQSVRLPGYVVTLVNKWNRSSHQLEQLLGRKPSDNEVARRLGLDASQRDRVVAVLQLSCTTGSDPADDWQMQQAPERSACPPEEIASQKETAEKLHALIDELTDQQGEVIRRRFGMDNRLPQTFRQIADDLNLSHERVRQVAYKGIEKLAHRLGLPSPRISLGRVESHQPTPSPTKGPHISIAPKRANRRTKGEMPALDLFAAAF